MTERSEGIQLRALLQSAHVEQLTLKVRQQLAPTDTFGSAVALMRNRSHGCALICNEGELVGILTERDILHSLHSGVDYETPIASLMTQQPTTVTNRDTLFHVIGLMDDDVGALGEDVERVVRDDRRHLEGDAIVRVEPAHLHVQPDQMIDRHKVDPM